MTPLKFKLVSIDHSVLQVKFAPASKMEVFFPLFAAVRELAEAHHVKNILLDVRAFHNRIGSLQWLQLALALVDTFLGYKVAGVMSAESFDPQHLAETMARNRGGNVKLTTSILEAQAWLGVKPPRVKPVGRTHDRVKA